MEEKTKKPIVKKWWFWVLIVLVVVILLAALGKGGKNEKTDPANPDAGTQATENVDKTETKAAAQEAYEIGEGTVKVWKSSIQTPWVSVAIPVKNTGTENLYLSSASVDIEDASGNLVKTLSMVSVYPQILKPGETAYYFNETTAEEALPAEGLKAIPHVSVKKASADCIRYAVSETAVKDSDYYGAKVSGRVENTTDEVGKMVYVVAQLFDANGQLLAQQFTILDNDLQPGEKIGFETSNLGSNIAAADVASFEVFAFPLQYQF
ncbi:MAG: hypothetical protein IJK64_00540 [Clostridia bacterium]|nr:hypothetical protein [Clostridia bacterium]